MNKVFIIFFMAISLTSCNENPSLKGNYNFEFIKNKKGEKLISVTPKDTLILNDESFQYYLLEKGNLFAKGDYQFSNDTLIFEYNLPRDTTRRYFVKTLNDHSLVIEENGVLFGFKRKK